MKKDDIVSQMRHGSFHVAHWDPTSYLPERLLIEANVLSWKAEPVPDTFQIGLVQWKGACLSLETCGAHAARWWFIQSVCRVPTGLPLQTECQESTMWFIVNVNVNDMNQICCKCPRIPDSGNPFTSPLTACHTHNWAFHTIWCVGEAVLGVLLIRVLGSSV